MRECKAFEKIVAETKEQNRLKRNAAARKRYAKSKMLNLLREGLK